MSNENERYVVDLPISAAVADVAGAPASVIERIVRAVGRPDGSPAFSAAGPILSDEAVERALNAVPWPNVQGNAKVRHFLDGRAEDKATIMRAALSAAFSPPPEPAPSSPVPVEAPNAGLIRVRNEMGRFTEFINEDVPTVVRDIHPGVDVLLDLDTRKVVGFRVYDLTDFDALAEAWCRLAGKAIDALDTIASWDADGFKSYEIVSPIAEFAEKSAAEIRAAYPKEAILPAAPAHREVGEPDACPICLVAFKPDDMCLTDIELGTCHAACLDGSPMVDLETGDPLPEGVLPKPYRYEPDAVMCGGCGNSDPNKRCIGCGHDFYPPTGDSNV